MIDFTFSGYINYIKTIKTSYDFILRFDQYLRTDIKPECFCIIRHDVDRKAHNALKMAQLESSLGVRSTYYFRAKPNTFKPWIIRKIAKFGHEIGYHYESLSDTKGNLADAIKNFEKNLKRFRKIAPIHTISMHGKPFSSYNNSDMWRHNTFNKLLKDQYKILGEIYLDIDYTSITYVNDTGRNWSSTKANLRDKVQSEVDIAFSNGNELLTYLKTSSSKKLILSTHPERWSHSTLDYFYQITFDFLANKVKTLL